MIPVRIADRLPVPVHEPSAETIQKEDDESGECEAKEGAGQAVAGQDVMEEQHEKNETANDNEHQAGTGKPP